MLTKQISKYQNTLKSIQNDVVIPLKDKMTRIDLENQALKMKIDSLEKEGTNLTPNTNRNADWLEKEIRSLNRNLSHLEAEIASKESMMNSIELEKGTGFSVLSGSLRHNFTDGDNEFRNDNSGWVNNGMNGQVGSMWGGWDNLTLTFHLYPYAYEDSVYTFTMYYELYPVTVANS